MAAPIHADTGITGLGVEAKRDWPRVVRAAPIDALRPQSEAHDRVLRYLTTRIRASEREMKNFYARWAVNEKHIQAFIDLPNWEKRLKEANDTGKPPKPVSVVIPTTYSTIGSVVTFLLHVFTGQKPMFQVGTYKDETVNAARKMELVLQYQADHIRLIKQLWQFLQDSLVYGVGILRVDWRTETRQRRVQQQVQQLDLLGNPVLTTQESIQQVISYEGNIVLAQDPFGFFPDPRVPMSDVNRRGEFVFWRNFEGRHSLKRDQAAGILSHVDAIPPSIPRQGLSGGLSASARAAFSGGLAFPGLEGTAGGESQGFVQIDEGTIEIIPRELGLGDSEAPEKWMFTIGNMGQILQAAPLDADHGMHPVAVTEPTSLGYGLGHASLADYMVPIQDAMSWLYNSHQDNVRRTINDVLLVDPSAIEMQDLKNMSGGGIVRLKQSALGRDIRSVLSQLNMVDITRAHLGDMQTIFKIGQQISAVDENRLGTPATGGRKTATEVRTSAELGSSRLAALTRIISAQGITDLTEMMSINTQQKLSQEFYLRVVGMEGIQTPIRITPDQLAGDFFYPIHDGTLPLDRVAIASVWQQIFGLVLQDQELRQAYSVPKIFEFMAELAGAKNIQAMRLQTQPQAPGMIQSQVQQGNLAPVPGGTANPSARIAGVLGGLNQ